MRQLLTRLNHWPTVSGVKRLKGDLAGHYRLRTGDYRLQFRIEQTKRVVTETRVVKGKTMTEEREVEDLRVIVERAGHRDGFYDE
jgi:mRNA-degrading endonuclease RelE of RelBE toxin-antitoxin system